MKLSKQKTEILRSMHTPISQSHWACVLFKNFRESIIEMRKFFSEVLTQIPEHFCAYLRLHWANHSDLRRMSCSQITTIGPVSCIFSVTWLVGDVKEPTHLSRSVGYGVPRVVVWPLISHGLVLHIGLTSLHLSPLNRIVQEKLLTMTMTMTMTMT